MSTDKKTELFEIFSEGLEAVRPDNAIYRNVSRDGDCLKVFDDVYNLADFERIIVVGAGKGAAPMAKAIEDILSDKLDSGAIVVKYDHTKKLDKTKVYEAAHPVPDEAGITASNSILEILEGSGKGDLVICVLTGGTSSLLLSPADITLKDKQNTTKQLLGSGANIHEINTIRKHLSNVKGGRLAKTAFPATVISLIVSDVIGDDLTSIGSGPTVADPTTFSDCMKILEKYELKKSLPQSVVNRLEKGFENSELETPKENDPCFKNVHNYLVANNEIALLAADKKATELGYMSMILTTCMEGEAKEAAKMLASVAKEIKRNNRPVKTPACLLVGGETTVTLKGKGKGGRNQELALAMAIELENTDGIAVLSAGTDGSDGPTDAAGAYALAETVKLAKAKNLDPLDYLKQNDSYNFFKQINELIITKPTLTNVMDMVVILVN